MATEETVKRKPHGMTGKQWRLLSRLLGMAHANNPTIGVFEIAQRVSNVFASVADVHVLAAKLKVDKLKKENP